MKLKDSKENQTPANIKPLAKDKNSPPCEEMSSYASAIRMIMH
jgi:hypothetical protein